MSDKKKIPVQKEFTSQYQCTNGNPSGQQKPNKLFIGIPKEITMQENRVALVPSSVAPLVAHGDTASSSKPMPGKVQLFGP